MLYHQTAGVSGPWAPGNSPEVLDGLVLLRKGWSREGIQRDVTNPTATLKILPWEGIRKVWGYVFLLMLKISALFHITAFSPFTCIASLLLGCWCIWKLMGCWVWKRGGGGKRRKEIGQKNSRDRFWNPNPVLRLIFLFVCSAAFHSRLTGTDKPEQLAEQNDRKMEG